MQVGILFSLFMVVHIVVDAVLFFCGINVIEKIGFCYKHIQNQKESIIVKNSKIYSYLFSLVACAILLHPGKNFIVDFFPNNTKYLICIIIYATFWHNYFSCFSIVENYVYVQRPFCPSRGFAIELSRLKKSVWCSLGGPRYLGVWLFVVDDGKRYKSYCTSSVKASDFLDKYGVENE